VPRLREVKGGTGVKTESTHGNESSDVARPSARDIDHTHDVKDESDTINVKMAPPESNGHIVISPQEPIAFLPTPTNSGLNHDKLAKPTPVENPAARNDAVVSSALSDIDGKPGQLHDSAAIADLPQSTSPITNRADLAQTLPNNTASTHAQ